jgi:hypothetical protein
MKTDVLNHVPTGTVSYILHVCFPVEKKKIQKQGFVGLFGLGPWFVSL